MDEDFRSTVDPACLHRPPLALDMIKQLDTFEFSLYLILTFMSCVSLLLYLEQCAFLYKKQSYPMKTTIIWVSGAAPIIATMACLGMWFPRATMFTDMTSNCYFAVVVYRFFVLMVEEFGGSTAFLKRFSGKPFMINTGPCCCCCPCLPRVPMSRRMLFLLNLAGLQYAILRTAFSVFCIILWTNGIYDLTNLSATSATLWINLSVGVLTIISLWPVGIIFMNLRSLLRSVKFIPKYSMYQLVFVLSQLQSSIINILAINGQIACAPPLSSQARGTMLTQKLMIMEMFIISVVNYFLYRRIYDPLPAEEHDNEENDKAALQAALEEHDV